MSGEVSIDRRLSPTGRFIRNALDGALGAVDNGKLLPIGSGTPGLIWRGALTTSPTAIGGTSGDPLINLPGQGGAWGLPAGYRYDVETFLTIRDGTAAPSANPLAIAVEGSIDGGVTWTVVLLTETLAAVTLAANEAGCFTVARLTAAPTTSTITNVRTRALRIGTTALISDSWTKIIQHVT